MYPTGKYASNVQEGQDASAVWGISRTTIHQTGSSTIDEYRAFAESLNNQQMFTESAKGQSRAEAKGHEAARISREGQNTYGAVPDPDLDSKVVLQTETKIHGKRKKAALEAALKDRMMLLRKIDVLDRNSAK